MNVRRLVLTPPRRRTVLLLILLMAMLLLATTNRLRARAAAPELWIPVNVPAWRVG
jgi:hypothetical protein